VGNLNLEQLISKSKIKPKDTKIAVVLGDFHIPFHDKKAVGLAFGFCEDKQPDTIVLNGDFIDMYSISKFDKNPLRWFNIQDELDNAYEILKDLRARCPKSDIVYTEGNHEERLMKYIWKHPELAGLEVLSMPSLLKLKSLDIKFVPKTKDYYIKKLLVTHGDRIRKHSAYTARAVMEDYGVNCVINHTHRGGAHYKTDRSGVHGAFENFCLCDLSPEYVAKPNWQQGLSVVFYEAHGTRYHIIQCPIFLKEIMFGDTVYSVRGGKK
jgi:predicted phosphodiesterase